MKIDTSRPTAVAPRTSQGREHAATAVRLLAAVILSLVLTSTLAAQEQTRPPLNQVAALLTGALVMDGDTIYRVVEVRTLEYTHYGLALSADADPLFGDLIGWTPDGEDHGRPYYRLKLARDTPCGRPLMPNELIAAHPRVLDGTRFIPMDEFLANRFPDMTPPQRPDPDIRTTPAQRDILQACAAHLADIGDAKPFSEISLRAQDQLLAALRRSLSETWSYDEGVGEEIQYRLGHIEITPRQGAMIEDFSVVFQTVSIMHCDYEGPHLELTDWKRAYSPPVQLERRGQRFAIPPAALTFEPPFPAYTQAELRRAIGQLFGSEESASASDAEPCAPTLGGYRVTVSYRSRTVQEMWIWFAGGC